MKTERKSALIAGFALILMAVAAAFSFGYVHNSLVVPGNTESTVNNLKSSGLLFKAEIMGWTLILILDVVVAWALYNFFRNENRKLSAAMAWLRIVYSG
ncbi:MAG: DUF4386 domain-containing protein, partial [Prolixibacteraceae bacterium]|nr:DUF4386 domain-containing protein [Prolixibacteraceae bacterium]